MDFKPVINFDYQDDEGEGSIHFIKEDEDMTIDLYQDDMYTSIVLEPADIAQLRAWLSGQFSD